MMLMLQETAMRESSVLNCSVKPARKRMAAIWSCWAARSCRPISGALNSSGKTAKSLW